MSVPRCAPTWGALFRGSLLNIAGIALVTVPASGLLVKVLNGPAIGSLGKAPRDSSQIAAFNARPSSPDFYRLFPCQDN